MTSAPASGSEANKTETKDLQLMVPIERSYDPAIKTAARREGRPVAGLVRYLILRHLRSEGLVDNNFNVLDSAEETA
jgi:hypothetical protein